MGACDVTTTLQPALCIAPQKLIKGTFLPQFWLISIRVLARLMQVNF